MEISFFVFCLFWIVLGFHLWSIRQTLRMIQAYSVENTRLKFISDFLNLIRQDLAQTGGISGFEELLKKIEQNTRKSSGASKP